MRRLSVTRFDEVALSLEAELETRRRVRRDARLIALAWHVIALVGITVGIVYLGVLVYQASRPGSDGGVAPTQPETSVAPIADVSPPPAPVRLLGSRAVPTAREAFITAKASFYCNADASRGKLSRCRIGYPDGPGADLYAAAGPAVQGMMGSDWQGERVRVIGNGHEVIVTLIDACPGCSGVDLYADAFAQLAPLSRGTITPVLIRPMREPLPTVPPTDTE